MVKFWHILLAFLLTCCSAVETPAQTLTPEICPAINVWEVTEVIQDHADTLAIELSISTDEAICRILLMDVSGDLNARLEQEKADTFAGMWIEHQPEFKVVVAFTRDGEEIIQPYAENSILASSIEVQEAEVTQAELYKIEMEANQLVGSLGLSMIGFTLVNIQENQVEIHISDTKLLEERLTANQLELPDQVKTVSNLKEYVKYPPAILTPVPGVHFPQLIASPPLVYAITTVGRLQSHSGCFRLTRTDDDPGPLLIWHPGHYLHSNQGVIEVLDQDGEVLAREGDLSCFSSAAGEISPDTDWFLSNPLPNECSPQNFVVGEVQLAYQENQALTLIDVKLFAWKMLLSIISRQPPILMNGCKSQPQFLENWFGRIILDVSDSNEKA